MACYHLSDAPRSQDPWAAGSYISRRDERCVPIGFVWFYFMSKADADTPSQARLGLYTSRRNEDTLGNRGTPPLPRGRHPVHMEHEGPATALQLSRRHDESGAVSCMALSVAIQSRLSLRQIRRVYQDDPVDVKWRFSESDMHAAPLFRRNDGRLMFAS